MFKEMGDLYFSSLLKTLLVYILERYQNPEVKAFFYGYIKHEDTF